MTLSEASHHRPGSDAPFFAGFLGVALLYWLGIVALLLAAATYTTPGALLRSLQTPEVLSSIRLSLLTCTLSAIASLWTAVPIGYLLARFKFPGRSLVDAVLDIPIVLPPLVVGLCLLIFFRTPAGQGIEQAFTAVAGWLMHDPPEITYDVPAIILSQFMVACAFAVRTMRVVFEQMDPRCEQVALTLGCNAGGAFWRVAFPQATSGMIAGGTLAWARSLGEFGPILIFAGATRGKTEVLSTTVFLELTVGNINGAIAASLIMVAAAMLVLLTARLCGLRATAV